MELHSTVAGEAEKNGSPPLILLHGLFGMGSNLSMVSRSLAEFFTVYSLDLRNHGQSPWADSMSFTEMANDVLEFMDSRSMDQALVVGHSLGGKVAMQLALEHPKKVAKLVVADIAPVTYKHIHGDVFAGMKAIPLAELQSRRDAETVLKAYINDAGVRAFILKNLYRQANGQFGWRPNLSALDKCYEQLRQANHSDTAYSGPVLFIKGENSDYIQPAYRPEIESLFPNAKLKIIQNTGHWLHAEKPTVFNNIVKKFLQSA